MMRAFVVLAVLAAPATAAAGELSLSTAYGTPAVCDSIQDGMAAVDLMFEDTGEPVLLVERTRIAGLEWQCTVKSASGTKSGYKVKASCASEGVEYDDEFTLDFIDGRKGMVVRQPDAEPLEIRSCGPAPAQAG